MIHFIFCDAQIYHCFLTSLIELHFLLCDLIISAVTALVVKETVKLKNIMLNTCKHLKSIQNPREIPMYPLFQLWSLQIQQ